MVAASIKQGMNAKASKVKRSLNAQIFKFNVDNEIQKHDDGTTKQGARYECIYKNLFRDIRQFYSDKFDEFVT